MNGNASDLVVRANHETHKCSLVVVVVVSVLAKPVLVSTASKIQLMAMARKTTGQRRDDVMM